MYTYLYLLILFIFALFFIILKINSQKYYQCKMDKNTYVLRNSDNIQQACTLLTKTRQNIIQLSNFLKK